MSTFGDMKTRIADELDRSDLTTQIGLEILTAIAHYENQRWSWSEIRATASTVANIPYVAVPSNFLDEDSLKITISGDYEIMRRVTYEYLDKIDSGTDEAEPSCYAFYAGQIRLYPIPDAVYTLTFSYIGSQTALSADADTNDWTNEGEALIRARAKAAVKMNYLQDAGAIAEAQGYALNRMDYLCTAEASAYNSLRRKADMKTSTNTIQAWCI
jgi:hypothetical protein